MILSEMGVIDVIFVVSLSFLALSLLIFLIFFVPVLIQLYKTLEAVQTLINIVKDHVVNVNSTLSEASSNLGRLGTYLADLVGALGEGVIDLVFKARK